MRRTFLGAAIAAVAAVAPAFLSAGEQDDKAAAQQIATELRDSGKLHNYSLGVKVQGSTVWLNGRVASKQQMVDALQTVSDLDGVDRIVNNLQVGGGDAAHRGPNAAANKRSGKAGKGKQPNAVRLASAQAHMPVDAAEIPAMSSFDESTEARPASYYPLPHRAARASAANCAAGGCQVGGPGVVTGGGPLPAYLPGVGGGVAASAYDEPHLPNYSWPSYASYPNYAALTYPKQYSATAWPFIGPFYPYPQVPLGWRKVSLEWDDGWWFLDFQDRCGH